MVQYIVSLYGKEYIEYIAIYWRQQVIITTFKHDVFLKDQFVNLLKKVMITF